MKEDRLLNLRQVADMLGHVSVKTVRRLIAGGKLRAVKFSRTPMLPLSEVSDFIETLKTQRRGAKA